MTFISKELGNRGAQRKKLATFSWADAGMLAVSLIWGVNFTIVKQALVELSPMVFVSLRFALASLCLLGILFAARENLRFRQREIGSLLLIALVGHVGYQVCFIKGIELTTASNSSLLLATSPIFIALLGLIMRVERLSLHIGVGVGLSFTGIVLIVGLGAGGVSAALDTLPGNLLTLAAAICWSFNTILSKPLLQHYSPLKVTSVTLALGTPFLIMASLGELGGQNFAQVSAQGWLGVVFSSLFANGVAYVLWNVSVQKVGAARTAVFTNLVPVIAVLTSWLFLGETLGVWQGVGAIITLAGVTLTRLAPRPAHDQSLIEQVETCTSCRQPAVTSGAHKV